jgi:hypothetical protein
MVGVAGRSRGCLTCRARKKGVSLIDVCIEIICALLTAFSATNSGHTVGDPFCGVTLKDVRLILNLIGGQCRRSNLVCQGYQEPLTFIMYQQSDGRLHSTGQMIVRPKSTSLSPTTISNFSLNNSAFESQLFDKYWDTFYPQTAKAPFGHDPSETQLGSWQVAVKNQCLDDRLVRTALLAIANGSMASTSEDSRFKLAAMEAYSRVLMEVNLALQAADKQTSDSVLATCKLLATFEVSIIPITEPTRSTNNCLGFRGSKCSFLCQLSKVTIPFHR